MTDMRMEDALAEIARLRTRYDSATDQAVRYADDNARLTAALKDIECNSIDHTDACRMAGNARRALERKP